MQVAISCLDLVDHNFIHVLRPATGDHVDAVHTGVNVPIDAVDLLETDALVALEEVTDHGQSLFDAFDLFQPFDVSRIEIGSGRGQLDGARPHEDHLGTDVGRASVYVVGNAGGESGEKHHQAASKSPTRHADERTNRAL